MRLFDDRYEGQRRQLKDLVRCSIANIYLCKPLRD